MDRVKRKFLGLAMVLALLLAGGSGFFSTVALATEDPIPLIDVVVKKTPPGNGFTARTDRNGYLVFKWLAAGNYVVSGKNGATNTIRHLGGPARWKLLGTTSGGKSVWTLVDESNPL